MTVVRELVATLGLGIDRRSFTDGDRAIGGIRNALGSLGIGIGVAGIVASLKEVVTAASDVNETLNVVQASFGESTGSVLDWAKTTSKEIGRSEFKLREMAAGLGALLTPMMKNEEASAGMSTQLAKLAVDLSSFFNATENDALTALRAGLIGESEPLRRFGVQLSEVRVQEMAMLMGLAKNKKHIDNAAKAQARFAIILEDTVKAQGDAARTGDGYANLVRRMEGGFFDLKVAIGSTVLGPATAFIRWLADGAVAVGEWLKKTRLVEATLITLGGVMTAFGIRALVANAPLLLWAAAFAAIILLVEDFIRTIEGGPSAIGDLGLALERFWVGLIGQDNWNAFIDTWSKSMEAVGDLFFEWLNGIEGAWDRFLEKLHLPSFRDMVSSSLGIGDSALRGEQAILNNGFGGKNEPRGDVRAQEASFVSAMRNGGFWSTMAGFVTGKSGGSAASVRGGNMTVIVQGNADRQTVRDIERVVREGSDAQSRDLLQSTDALMSGG